MCFDPCDLIDVLGRPRADVGAARCQRDADGSSPHASTTSKRLTANIHRAERTATSTTANNQGAGPGPAGEHGRGGTHDHRLTYWPVRGSQTLRIDRERVQRIIASKPTATAHASNHAVLADLLIRSQMLPATPKLRVAGDTADRQRER